MLNKSEKKLFNILFSWYFTFGSYFYDFYLATSEE